MDFSKLKELTKRLGGILVLDGDEPEFVILPYNKYENIDTGEEIYFSKKSNGTAYANGINPDRLDLAEDGDEAVEKLNQEILALKEEIRQKEEAELVADEQSTEPIAETIDFE
ncbi:MAG: hypothetical protein AAB784_00915 [Patescibacteria group bacterium]